MKLAGVCPACEMHAEFVSVPAGTGSGRVFRCSNCWHYLDDDELAHAQTIAGELAELEEKRKRILGG